VSELDYYPMQVSMNGSQVSIVFVEEAFTSEDASVVNTINIEIGDDLGLRNSMTIIQQHLNDMIVRGYQMLRDAK
jgi:hypothetical protein